MTPLSLHLPNGWFAAALDVHASLENPSLSSNPVAHVLDPHTSWVRFRELQSREIPTITSSRQTYSVIDMEVLESENDQPAFLYYAHSKSGGDRRGHWAIFLQEGSLDTEPLQIQPKQIRDMLLQPYRDPPLLIRPSEITQSHVIGRGPVESLPDAGASELLRQTLTLQNGHPLTFVWKNRAETDWIARTPEGSLREVWHLTPDLLEKLILEIPLHVLTQVDEIRLRSSCHSFSHGQSFRKNGRRIVNLFPNDVEPTTAIGHRVISDPDLKSLSPWRARLYRQRYTLFHEVFGHSLVNNRFIRREIIKIIASGERPPSIYASTSPDEWFAEGVAERWIRVVYKNPELPHWDKTHAYLSGLLRHLLARLEQRAEPANANIEQWARSMRRSKLLERSPSTALIRKR